MATQMANSTRFIENNPSNLVSISQSVDVDIHENKLISVDNKTSGVAHAVMDEAFAAVADIAAISGCRFWLICPSGRKAFIGKVYHWAVRQSAEEPAHTPADKIPYDAYVPVLGRKEHAYGLSSRQVSALLESVEERRDEADLLFTSYRKVIPQLDIASDFIDRGRLPASLSVQDLIALLNFANDFNRPVLREKALNELVQFPLDNAEEPLKGGVLSDDLILTWAEKRPSQEVFALSLIHI